ncbi:unnamed protein product, partial [Rotaria sp. Silwood1]
VSIIINGDLPKRLNKT